MKNMDLDLYQPENQKVLKILENDSNISYHLFLLYEKRAYG